MNLQEALAIGITGIFLGFCIRCGIPGSGEILLTSWEVVSSFLIYILDINQHFFITIASVIIIPIAIFLIIRPAISAIIFGIEGLIILIIGFIISFFVTGWLIEIVYSITGLII
jgi:hypothetical protein